MQLSTDLEKQNRSNQVEKSKIRSQAAQSSYRRKVRNRYLLSTCGKPCWPLNIRKMQGIRTIKPYGCLPSVPIPVHVALSKQALYILSRICPCTYMRHAARSSSGGQTTNLPKLPLNVSEVSKHSRLFGVLFKPRLSPPVLGSLGFSSLHILADRIFSILLNFCCVSALLSHDGCWWW